MNTDDPISLTTVHDLPTNVHNWVASNVLGWVIMQGSDWHDSKGSILGSGSTLFAGNDYAIKLLVEHMLANGWSINWHRDWDAKNNTQIHKVSVVKKAPKVFTAGKWSLLGKGVYTNYGTALCRAVYFGVQKEAEVAGNELPTALGYLARIASPDSPAGYVAPPNAYEIMRRISTDSVMPTDDDKLNEWCGIYFMNWCRASDGWVERNPPHKFWPHEQPFHDSSEARQALTLKIVNYGWKIEVTFINPFKVICTHANNAAWHVTASDKNQAVAIMKTAWLIKHFKPPTEDAVDEPIVHEDAEGACNALAVELTAVKEKLASLVEEQDALWHVLDPSDEYEGKDITNIVRWKMDELKTNTTLLNKYIGVGNTFFQDGPLSGFGKLGDSKCDLIHKALQNYVIMRLYLLK